MTVVLTILGAILLALLVLLEAGQPPRPTTSLYELRRRRAAKDKKATDILRREELRVQLSALKASLQALLLVGLVVALMYSLGWGRGIAAALAAALLYSRFAHVGAVRKLSSRIYTRSEQKLLTLTEKHGSVLRVVTGKVPLSQPTLPLGSREELTHLLESSPIFSTEDKKLLESVLGFSDQIVSDIMTKKDSIVTVKPSELLGPLVLDDLHKTKHEIFPVEKNGEIIGLLDIRDHVALKRKESVHARDVMYAGVVRINQTEPLDEALRVLVAAKQPYLIVVDDDGQTVGMLGLGDVIRALTGWSRR